ncbi:MAG TPA: thiamine pyrophosphate-dependent dehydrogenase E1 component subunit alpha, partial [Casimicrobiaceae bacterium]
MSKTPDAGDGHANAADTQATALRLYRRMLLIRRMEERLGDVQKAGELPGPVHLYIGQEAVAVGVCDHLNDRDWIASTHRGHGHFLAKGGDPTSMVAEIFGRSTGICGGKGGSMHVADVRRGILGANGIVGGGIGLATGAALAAQLDGKRRVAVAFFGDGGANQGVLMEALNLSAIWKLPLVLVCENNGFSEFSPTATVTAGEIVARATPFGVAAAKANGNDVLDLHRVAGEAVERARLGDGPTLIEARTYR